MIKNVYRYVHTVIDANKFLEDTGNKYMLVSQSPYRGKSDEAGETILPAGVKVRLQIQEDFSDPVVDRKTGEPMEDNRYENFDVTIVGCSYPLPLKKGDMVSLGEFLSQYSFYIDYNCILRFGKILEYKEK